MPSARRRRSCAGRSPRRGLRWKRNARRCWSETAHWSRARAALLTAQNAVDARGGDLEESTRTLESERKKTATLGAELAQQRDAKAQLTKTMASLQRELERGRARSRDQRR